MQKYSTYTLYQDSSSESAKHPNQIKWPIPIIEQVSAIPLTSTILLVFAKLQIRWKLCNPATRNHRTNPRQIRSRKKPSKPPRKRSIPANSLFRRMEHIFQGTVVPSTRWNPGAATMIDCGWWIIPRDSTPQVESRFRRLLFPYVYVARCLHAYLYVFIDLRACILRWPCWFRGG